MVDRTQSVARQNAVANPFTGNAATQVFPAALAGIEQQRAIAEVQARMVIARSNPRDAIHCVDMILQDCTRTTLAETALYQYSRGGQAVSGPSIRLAESIARRWGNIASGIKEISRANGYSECVAYAWDLESGYYDERQFQVKHWRDTKSGGYPLTDERDIYELIANMGQRRKRAVLLTVIPGDVVEAAVEQCEQTLKASADTSPDALRKIADAFATIGVTRDQIEKRCQCRLEAIRPAQILQLRKIYVSIKDEMSDVADWFASGLEMEAERGQAEIKAAKATTKSPRQAETESRPSNSLSSAGGAGSTADDSAGDGGGAATDLNSAPDAGGISPSRNGRVPPSDPASGSAGTPGPEIWAVDEFGDAIDRPEPMTPREFSNWFSARLFLSQNPNALRENNADQIAEATVDAVAAAEVADAIARLEKREAEKNAPPPAAPKRQPIKMPMTPKGASKPHEYSPLAKAQIAELKDEADIADWIAVNQPTYKNKSVEIAIENWLRDRRRQLAPPPEPPAQEAQSPTDILSSDDPMFPTWVETTMAGIDTDADIIAWSKQPAVMAEMKKLMGRDKELEAKVFAIIDTRRIAVTKG